MNAFSCNITYYILTNIILRDALLEIESNQSNGKNSSRYTSFYAASLNRGTEIFINANWLFHAWIAAILLDYIFYILLFLY